MLNTAWRMLGYAGKNIHAPVLGIDLVNTIIIDIVKRVLIRVQ